MNFHKPWGAFLEDPEKCSYSKSRSNISNLMTAVLFYLLNMTRSTLHTRRISRRIHLSVTPFGVTKNSFARPKRFHSEAFDRQILRVRVWQKKKSTLELKTKKRCFFLVLSRYGNTSESWGGEKTLWERVTPAFDLWGREQCLICG